MRILIFHIIAVISFTGIYAQTYTLTYSTDGNGIIIGDPIQILEYSDNGDEVTAEPNPGYFFTEWSDGVASSSRTDENVTGDILVTAIFSPIPPSAILSGNATICQGATATLQLDLTGIGPWEVTYKDDENNYTLQGIPNSPQNFIESPETSKTYTLVSVKDSYDIPGEVSGSAIITVDPLTAGGVVSGDVSDLLLTQPTGTLALSEHVGTVSGWQKSFGNDLSWTNIAGTENQSTYSEIPAITGTYYYRAIVQSGVCATANSEYFMITVSNSPVIGNANYDASSGALIIDGQNLNQEVEIDVTKLTISNGISSFTFTNQTPNVKPSSASRATILVGGKDKAFVNWIFNENGFRSKNGFLYNIAAAENWNGPALENPSSTVFIYNFLPPSIESAIYNKARLTLDVKALRLAAAPEPVKDIDATKFIITGKNNESYKLTTSSPNVNVLSETNFIINLGAVDNTEISRILDIAGVTSSTGHPYLLKAENRWNIPVHNDYNISDPTGKQILTQLFDNQPPVASNVIITGSPEIGKTITGSYTYFDEEGDAEDDSEFAWYRADDASGTGEILIEGEDEISYTLTLEDAKKFISFEVTPVAVDGTTHGDPVKSPYIEVLNSPPSATNVIINGIFEISNVLTVTYDYFDPEDDPEGNSIIKWLRADDDSGINEQLIYEGPGYTLTLNDEGKYIKAEVTPVAISGTKEGSPEQSQYYGPVKNTLPTASINGPTAFCSGSSVDIIFELTGLAPWTVYYTIGTNQFSFTTDTSPYVLNTIKEGIYKVTRLVDAEGFEGAELGDELIMNNIPNILIDDWYIENFVNTSSEWKAEVPFGETANSWTFGQPDGDIFTSASSGVNIWYTNITDKNIAEQSWVASPCFDFREVKRPMIAIDLWKKFGKNHDGAVLQYSINNSISWQNLGETDQGINWFNSSQIAGSPGNQETGWTAPEPGNTDTWIEARHDLDALSGENFVRFRVAYGSDGEGQTEGGVAFDNIRIGERSRLVLLEHFTNAADENSIEANHIVNDILQSKKYDFAYISYHTSFPKNDPINQQNPADPASRAVYYSISQAPFSIMDGGLDGEGRFDYSTSGFNETDLLKRALADPGFEIEITQEQSDNILNVEVEVSSVFTLGPLDLTLHVAIIETEIAATLIGLQSDEVYRNVVKKLIPNAGGTPLPLSWTANQSQTFNFSWTISNVFDVEKLAVVAFVQDENTKNIYNVGTSSEFNIPTMVDLPDNKTDLADVVFYPNPATEYLFIQFSENLIGNHLLEVFNLSGNMVQTEILREGNSSYEFDVNRLPRGLYLFRIKNDRDIIGTARVMIMK